MKILITGSNGVIGKFLTKKLKDHDMFTPKSSAVDFSNKEQVDYFFKHNNNFDLIIHCAVKGGSRLAKDDWGAMDTNIKMYLNLLDHRDKYGRFITFGSGAEIYMSNEPYGLSKKAITKSMSDKDNFYNIRIYGLFGDGELETRFIRASLQNYINKQPIQINENKIMDFFYMEDLWTLVKYYINNPNPPKEIDCCYGEYKKTLRGIANTINSLGDYEVEVLAPPHMFMPTKEYFGDSTILESLELKLIGFEQALKLEYEKYKLYN
jgi:nucleoside-diphosphate-sugar epimerase